MKKLIIICISWGVELAAFHRWFSCWLFSSTFYFTPQVLAANLLNATNAEKGMPILVIRALHNKIVTLAWGVLQTILQYWDIRFLEEFVGIVGAIGVMGGIWYVVTRYRKNVFLWVFVGVGILLQIIEIYIVPNFPYGQRIIPLVLFFQLLSLFGVWQFLKKNTCMRYGIVICLLVLSLIALVIFPLSYQAFCLKS